MPFIIRILLIYIFSEERTVINEITKFLFKKTRSRLTSNEFNRLFKFAKNLDAKAFARLPKATRNKLLQSINLYGILPLNQVDETLAKSSLSKYFYNQLVEDEDTKMDKLVSTPQTAMLEKLNKTFNPFYDYQKFIKTLKKENLQGNVKDVRHFFKQHNQEAKKITYQTGAINFNWNGDSASIIAAYFTADNITKPTGDLIIITLRGKREYTFYEFPKSMFLMWSETNDFGSLFWKHYYWPYYGRQNQH